MESLLTTIADYLWRQSWQIALLVGAVGLASWALRNRSAHVRYLLWLLVLAKCLTPPVVEVPLAVLPNKAPPVVIPIISTAPPQEGVRQTPVEEGLLPTPTSAAPEPLRLTTRQWLAVGWLAGVAVFASIALTKAARTILWLRRERRTLPRTSGDSFEETFRSLRVKRPPHIWLIVGVGQPFVWGILRGDIYLPNRFAGIDDDEHRRDILAHEISHVLRFDAAVNILQIIAQAIFWFHPLLWWANQRIRREREKCCDEMAIAHLGARPKDYSAAIVSTLIQAQESTRPVPSLAVAGPVKNIEERIRTMLRPGKRFHTRPSLAVATTVVLIALVAVPTTIVLTAAGQTQPSTQSVDTSATRNAESDRPSFAARTFNSKLVMDVFVQEKAKTSRPSRDQRWIGRTPSTAPLEIPACWLWWVQVNTQQVDGDLLAREIGEKKIPGLWISATGPDLRYLAGLTGLQSLGLAGNRITAASLEHLKGLTGLQDLDLWDTGMTDAGLAHLKGLTGLHSLNLSRNPQITDAGLEHLKGLTGLQKLDLNENEFTNSGLAHLKGLTGLQILLVGGPQITDAGLEHLKGLTGLQQLWLRIPGVTDAGIEHLKGLIRLQGLGLSDAQITDMGLANLKGLTGLQQLAVGGTRITDAGLAHIEGFTELQSLMLNLTQITDVGLANLKGLTGLQRLELNGTQITDAGLAHLKGLTGLQSLELGTNTHITDAGLAHLEGLTGLQRLWLAYNRITDAGLAHLEGLTALSELALNGNEITDAGLEHLKGLTKLKWLSLYDTQVTDAGEQRLKQRLPNLTVLRAQTK